MKYRFTSKAKPAGESDPQIHSAAAIPKGEISFYFMDLKQARADSGCQARNPRKTGLFRLKGPKKAYSAAAKASLLWAAECMKSEMRGTISDLKREPLNTP